MTPQMFEKRFQLKIKCLNGIARSLTPEMKQRLEAEIQNAFKEHCDAIAPQFVSDEASRLICALIDKGEFDEFPLPLEEAPKLFSLKEQAELCGALPIRTIVVG